MTTPKAELAGLALIAALWAGGISGLTAPAWAGLDEAQKDEIARNLPYVSDERRQLFRKRFLNGKGQRAFALSKDGAFGGRWGTNISMEEIRAWVLESCESKPQYRPENPCFIYMENDTVLGVR